MHTFGVRNTKLDFQNYIFKYYIERTRIQARRDRVCKDGGALIIIKVNSKDWKVGDLKLQDALVTVTDQ